MNLKDKIVVVTGGANGIGRAFCRRFAAEGAQGVVVADLDSAGAEIVAREVEGLAVPTDVSREEDIVDLVAQTIRKFGHIDLFCSNAGILGEFGGAEIPNESWQQIWEVNIMSHVFAARAVLPGMIERGNGYLLQTASAAGLLTQVGAAPYSVTKHAAVGFAEWLSITHASAGIKVSCLCPQGVKTQMLLGPDGNRESFLRAEALEPEEVADAVVAGLEEERFLILPHPIVAEYFLHKAEDYERWLRGMRRLNSQVQL